MSLHDRIREARKEAGLTQTQLAKAVGVATSTVSGWEGRMEPTAAQLGLVARATGTTAGFLLQDEIATQTAVSPREMRMITEYRGLDPYGQEAVDSVLAVEARRCRELSKPPDLTTSELTLEHQTRT